MAEPNKTPPKNEPPLRRGWTTGACAAAATKAAYTALLTGDFPDPVSIVLPKGQRPAFALAHQDRGDDFAEAGIVKDAGDDPDVTHGALIIARIRRNTTGGGIAFMAGPGVGTVTLPGLPIPPGEPAINPRPREMMRQVISEIGERYGDSGDVTIEIRVPGGEKIARETWNPRLGIVGGISILGTTGIVIPYSCSAWIHSIHRGIDVARALGLAHIAGCVGSTSEKMVRSHLRLPDSAYIDMGDFVGGMLKYLRRHPVQKVTIAGGFAKLTKLAQGARDLHSSRSQVDFAFLAQLAKELGARPNSQKRIKEANTALEALQIANGLGLDLPGLVAGRALAEARKVLESTDVEIEIMISDREGRCIARAPRETAATTG